MKVYLGIDLGGTKHCGRALSMNLIKSSPEESAKRVCPAMTA